MIFRRPRRIFGDIEIPNTFTGPDEEKVLKFLKSNSSMLRLGIKWGDWDYLASKETMTGKVIKYQQTYNGNPVQDALIVVKMGEINRIRSIQLSPTVISSYLFNWLGRIAPLRLVKFVSVLSGLPIGPYNPPTINSTDAIDIALKSLGLSPAGLREPPHVSPLSIVRHSKWKWGAVFNIIIPSKQPGETWQVVVDANSKKTEPIIFQKKNLVMKYQVIGYWSGKSAYISVPSPIVEFPNLMNQGDPKGKADVLIKQSASKELNGLKVIDDNGQKFVILSGQYVEIQDYFDPRQAPIRIPESSIDADLKRISIGSPEYQDVLVYHVIDMFQRYLQQNGITNVCNRSIAVDAHVHNSGNCNAWWDPWDLNRFPLGMICLGTGIPPGYPPSEDAETILHEYGHAIFNDQAKILITNQTSDEVDAIKEGFAIFLPCAYYGTDFPNDRDVFCDWTEYNPNSYGQQPTYPKMLVHWRNCNNNSYPKYPTDLGRAKGFLWSAILWQILTAANANFQSPKSECEDVRREMLQATITSLAGIYSRSKIPDAAEMLMEEDAELEDYRGRILPVMLDVFHEAQVFPSCANPNATIKYPTRGSRRSLPLNRNSRPIRCGIWTEKWIENGVTHINLCAKISSKGEDIRAFVVTFSLMDSQGASKTTVAKTAGFRLHRSRILRIEMPKGMWPTDESKMYKIVVDLYFGKNCTSPPPILSGDLPKRAFQ